MTGQRIPWSPSAGEQDSGRPEACFWQPHLDLRAVAAPMADWPVIGAYGGDAAWAMAAYAGWRLLFPTLNRLRIAGLAFGLATMVEISQLADWAWLNSIREQRLGALLLGRGFLWSDLVAYAVGTVTAMIIDVRSRSWIAGHRP